MKPGLTNVVPQIHFTFGTVAFTNVEPSNAVILRAESVPVEVGAPVFQRPNSPVLYRVEAPGYQTYSNSVVVAARQTRQFGVNLPRQTVAVNLGQRIRRVQSFSTTVPN